MKNAFRGVAGLTLIALAQTAAAQVWEWQPRIELGYEYDDNYRLDLPDNAIEVSGPDLDAQVALSSTGQRTQWTLTPRLHTNYFPDESAQESDDYYVLYDLRHSGEKYKTGLVARYTNETVVRSELPDFDTGGGFGGDTGADSGRISIGNQRQLADLRPTFEYTFSERRRLELEARYLNIDFDNIAVQQIAYDTYGATGGFSFAQSPRTDLIFSVVADRYEPEDVAGEATTYGADAEWATRPSEITRAYFTIGARQTEIERPVLVGDSTPTKTSYVAGAGGEWNTPLNRFLIDASHGIGPTASGFVVERDLLRLRWVRRLTERADLISSLRGVRDSSLESNVGYATRTYADGNVSLRWRLTRLFSLAAAYNYTWQEFDDEAAGRKSQGASLSFIYEPRRRD